jgi:DNA repair photolyase
VTDDIDVFKQIEGLRVNMSVTTDDDDTRKLFEPGCASIDRRLQAVSGLTAAGIAANICVSPMLPVTDPYAFAKRLVQSGANRVTSSYFHLGTRKFAAGTRENALVIAKDMGWNFERYLETVSVLRRLVPGFVSSETAFGPS